MLRHFIDHSSLFLTKCFLMTAFIILLSACSGGSGNSPSETPSGNNTGGDNTGGGNAGGGNAGGGNTAGSAISNRIVITSAPFPGSRSPDAQFSFSGPAGAEFECNLDNTVFASCTSPHQVTVSTGFHDMQVRAVINGQASSSIAKWHWEYANDLNLLASTESPFYNNGTAVPVISNLGSFSAQCEALTTLELRNDQNLDRSSDLAWSGVAIPRELDLRDSANLVLVGPDETLVAAQFRPLARWNAAISDSTAPLKWLEVAAVTATDSSSSANYSLRYCSTPPAVTDSSALQVTTNPDATVTVNTDISQVIFDPAEATGISSAQLGTASLSVILKIEGGAGQTGTVSANSSEFMVEESGPVKTVIRARGYVTGLTGQNCTDPLSYTLRWTLQRGSADMDVETDLVNECGDGMFPASSGGAIDGSDWWSRTQDISNMNLEFQINGVDANSILTRSSQDGITVSSSGGTGTTQALAVLQQNKGAIGNASGSDWRWAREEITTIPAGGGGVTDSEYFDLPVAAVSDANMTVMVQQPWMRFREPQGLAALSNYGSDTAYLNLYMISSDAANPFIVGEAQGVWGHGRLSIDMANLSNNEFSARAQRNNAALERGLLWHAPLWYLNQAKIYPELPDMNTAEMSTLLPLIQGAHDNSVTDSILGGAQRDRMKAYSLVGWIDSMQEGIKDTLNASLNEYSPGSNIWSPTNTELMMWFVTGDPEWVWDYALPAEWNLWKSNAYNTGSRGTVGIRNGLVIASSSIGDGARYRSGYGSDDKFYNQGSGKAYVIRPYRSLVERFRAAGDTVISRYADQLGNREDTVSSRVITRQVMQHLNALRFAAEFSPDNEVALHNKFDAMMQEYATDNLSHGSFCYSDDENSNQHDCAFAPSGIFHYVALWQELFYNHALDLPPGDSRRETIFNALANTARLIDSGIPRDSNNEVSDFSPTAWGDSYVCDFSSGSDIVSQCRQYNCTGFADPSGGSCPTDPTYDNAHLNTLGTVMIGHAIDSTLVTDERCTQARQGFNTNLNGSTVAGHLRDSGFGWHKDASQMVQTVLYAIAAAQQCN